MAWRWLKIPSADALLDKLNGAMKALEHELKNQGAFITFAASAATPSVAGGRLFRTNNSLATTITAFDGGVLGQEIELHVNDANTTIDFTGTTLRGNAGVNWSPTTGDAMRCTFDGTNWRCQIIDCTS